MHFAVVFDARFVAAELLLVRDCFDQFLIRLGQRSGNRPRAELRQVAARHRRLQDVFHPGFDRGATAMPDRLEPTDGGQQPGAEDRPFQFGTVREVQLAIGISIDGELMFGDMDRRLRQFDVLNGLEVAGWRQPQALDVVVYFVFDDLINAVGWERFSQMLLVSGLGPASRFLSSSGFLVLRFGFDTIARGGA